MIFPRMSALSEVLWSPKKGRDSVDFEKRLMTQFRRYDLWGINYSKAIFDFVSQVSPTEDNNGVYWSLSSKRKGKLNAEDLEHNPGSFSEVAKTDSSLKLRIVHSGLYRATEGPYTSLEQTFSFNKATGKKITLATPPARIYPGDGAFTLVNGVENEKGLGKPREFLGFNGADCEVTIDLGAIQEIREVRAHVLEATQSWIYRPKSMQVSISTDNSSFVPAGSTNSSQFNPNNQNGIMPVQLKPVSARYVKVKLENFGVIPEGSPGAGSKAWLFADEIEVN